MTQRQTTTPRRCQALTKAVGIPPLVVVAVVVVVVPTAAVAVSTRCAARLTRLMRGASHTREEAEAEAEAEQEHCPAAAAAAAAAVASPGMTMTRWCQRRSVLVMVTWVAVPHTLPLRLARRHGQVAHTHTPRHRVLAPPPTLRWARHSAAGIVRQVPGASRTSCVGTRLRMTGTTEACIDMGKMLRVVVVTESVVCGAQVAPVEGMQVPAVAAAVVVLVVIGVLILERDVNGVGTHTARGVGVVMQWVMSVNAPTTMTTGGWWSPCWRSIVRPGSRTMPRAPEVVVAVAGTTAVAAATEWVGLLLEKTGCASWKKFVFASNGSLRSGALRWIGPAQVATHRTGTANPRHRPKLFGGPVMEWTPRPPPVLNRWSELSRSVAGWVLRCCRTASMVLWPSRGGGRICGMVERRGSCNLLCMCAAACVVSGCPCTRGFPAARACNGKRCSTAGGWECVCDA